MRKITFALLSMLLITPCMANIHINPDAVTEVIAKHFPKKQVECFREYNAQVKASNGAGIAASKLWNVCAAGGLDTKKSADKEKCRAFVNDLTSKRTVKFYAVCGKDKNISGAVCVNDFAALTVNMLQAQGLARLYARNKSDNTIECKSTPRRETTTTTSINPHAMGMSSTSSTPYVQCTSHNSNKFYEFRFNNVEGSIDATNHKNFKTGICKIFNSKFVAKKYDNKNTFDICEGVSTESVCDKIDQAISAGDVGYVASWGPLGYKIADNGYKITSSNFPYCVLSESVAKGKDGYLLFERTAFGLDGRVFLITGIQRKGSDEIKKQIRTYVENTMGKANVKSFSCEDTYHTIRLNGRSGTDDMVRCTINGKVVEFFFDDLSEAWGVYDKSGREAMNCIAWGGTFTGKKCIGLDEAQCNVVRDANAQSCPECKKIKWNNKTKICELPASVDASNLKKGLTYGAMGVAGVASVVITIGTVGMGGTVAVILVAETIGAGIELGAQKNIDNEADKFFVDSASCDSESCAKELIQKYLVKLARMGRDLTDIEADATDKEMARLIGLIPTDSDWWIDYLRTDDGRSLLEKANDEKWTVAQVWRAVGIGMQFAGIASSITRLIIKRIGYLEKTLSRTSRILLKNAKIAEKNVVKHMDDEWKMLLDEYAPKNQTLDEFKDMADGDLDKMKEMVKDWTPRSKRPIINAQIDKQLDAAAANLRDKYDTWDNLIKKYNINIDDLDDSNELAKIYKEHSDLEQAKKTLEYAQSEVKKLQDAKFKYNNTNYSTHNPEFSKVSEQYMQKNDDVDKEIEEAWQEYSKLHPGSTMDEFNKTDTYKNFLWKKFEIKRDYQFEVAEKFPLENIDNVAMERADEFADIVANNPEVQSKLAFYNWHYNLAMDDQRRGYALMEQLAEEPTVKSKLSPNWQNIDREEAWREMVELVEKDDDVKKIVKDKYPELIYDKTESTAVVQQILDEYAKKTGTPVVDVYENHLTTADGYHSKGVNNAVFNPHSIDYQVPEGMVNTMAHEHGHLIDEFAPNEGALGEQFSYYSNKLYSNIEEAGYRVALTEQSSYKIGPKVSRKVTGVKNVFNEEYALEEAKKDLEKAKRQMELIIDGGLVGMPSEGGVTFGVIKQIREDKQNKEKDKK